MSGLWHHKCPEGLERQKCMAEGSMTCNALLRLVLQTWSRSTFLTATQLYICPITM